MNTITNYYYHQEVQPTNKKYDSKTYNENQRKFSDILELQSENSINHLEEYNYSSFQGYREVDLASSEEKMNSKIQIPPHSAPEGVKKTFENLGGWEQRIIQASILTAVRNSVGYPFDKNGNFDPIKQKEFEIEFNNFFNKDDFSYIDLTDKMINSWKQNKAFNSKDVYLRKMQTLEKFRSALIENGVS